ncbi:hypothetical protein [Idiomarina sp. UBA4520]|jgi:hypothetical protein|uniref:hypothetical protein n=1 Tax=Idiomarina sp. UBA4520 TaxID=1946647 RepID=UPI000ADA9F56|nr:MULTISPECIES: hypothetical protein [unclassified Idiomarina]MBF39219.1 hypothetical protein [Idiomarinaceae bacterium]|tara:strand:+ start:546 stop:1226 length:681 start_codon:yes stop_codon:yes gene_type:complete
MQSTIKVMLVVLLIMAATGCAASRDILDIKNNASVNPVEGKAIKFVRVSDNRDFQIEPRQADIPSLKNSEIHDAEITSRAIARKRDAHGMAWGDILLPEGKTVKGVVKNRLSEGFRASNYRVLSVEDEGYEQAIPVDIDIEKFWGWVSPGFWSIGLNFQTSIIVSAPTGIFSEGLKFDSEVQKRYQTGVIGNWEAVIELSLAELREDIKTKIQPTHVSKNSRQSDD